MKNLLIGIFLALIIGFGIIGLVQPNDSTQEINDQTSQITEKIVS